MALQAPDHDVHTVAGYSVAIKPGVNGEGHEVGTALSVL